MCALFLTSNSVTFLSLPSDFVIMKYHLLPSNGVSLFTISDLRIAIHRNEQSVQECRQIFCTSFCAV